jgi:hypothetical protein
VRVGVTVWITCVAVGSYVAVGSRVAVGRNFDVAIGARDAVGDGIAGEAHALRRMPL